MEGQSAVRVILCAFRQTQTRKHNLLDKGNKKLEVLVTDLLVLLEGRLSATTTTNFSSESVKVSELNWRSSTGHQESIAELQRHARRKQTPHGRRASADSLKLYNLETFLSPERSNEHRVNAKHGPNGSG